VPKCRVVLFGHILTYDYQDQYIFSVITSEPQRWGRTNT
jgi:hypothetical protein